MPDSFLGVDREELDRLLSVEVALDAAREAARASARGAVRTGRVQVAWPGEVHLGMRIMVAFIPSLDILGYKEFHIVGSDVRYLCHIFRASTGEQIGLVDAAELTTARTAATAAVGVEALYGAKRDAVVGVVGSGAEARAGLRALDAVLNVTEARVYSRRPENRSDFVAVLEPELAAPIRGCDSLEEATRSCDVVYAATQSHGSVVLTSADIAGVEVLATIGSTAPDQREVAGDVFVDAQRLVIDTEDALHESGDLIEARDAYGFDGSKVGLLGDALDLPSASSGGGLSVFKSIGSPEQDLILAARIVDAAAAQGRGTEITPISSVKVNL